MARIAVLGAYKDQMKLGWKQKLRAWFDLAIFDIILAYKLLIIFKLNLTFENL